MIRKSASDYDEILKLEVVFQTALFCNKHDIQDNKGEQEIW